MITQFKLFETRYENYSTWKRGDYVWYIGNETITRPPWEDGTDDYIIKKMHRDTNQMELAGMLGIFNCDDFTKNKKIAAQTKTQKKFDL